MYRAAGLLVCAAALGLWPSTTLAQDHVTARADFLFYGDNTEFSNPFRSGETTFGVAGSTAFAIDFGEHVRLHAGLFGNGRFGSPADVEQWRPVIAFELRNETSRFTMGTFDAPRRPEGMGPDRIVPHGILPALQIETLAFRRPWEAGLEWQYSGTRLRHDVWINWQKLHTPTRREVFDSGVRLEAPLTPVFAIGAQIHVVHHGGQQFDVGPVSDSSAYAAGVVLRPPVPEPGPLTLELYAVRSVHVPNRDEPALTTRGRAFFGRAALEIADWRGHLIAWRGLSVLKEDGDPNYLALRRDGTVYAKIRDYSEAGLTRIFHPAPEAELEVAARLHHTEGHFEYSYRILARVSMAWVLH
ncbi:MAG: hypothetical protein AB7F99_17485 [Vicinamibacterales bacterium]